VRKTAIRRKVMARKRRGKPINGWLIIDKPLGLTSSRVVGLVKHSLDAAKAGHGGTLDPLATGILPIALGEATKTVSYVMDGYKEYTFTVAWGESRDSDDLEGAVTGTSPARPEKTQILEALKEFVGEIEQIPPAYSAIKVEGRRAYDLARAGEDVALKSRLVFVENITLLTIPDCDHATFSVICGKGTYIRSIARDLAQHMGCLGHVSALRRTRVGPFTEKQAISVDSLESLGHSAALAEHLLAVETVLDDIPALALNADLAGALRNGQDVALFKATYLGTKTAAGYQDPSPELPENVVAGRSPVLALSGGRPVAIVRCEQGRIKPVRVFKL